MDRSNRARCARVLIQICVLSQLAAAGFAFAQDAAAPTDRAGSREVPLDEVLRHAEQHAPALVVANHRRGYAGAAREGAAALMRSNPTLEIGAGPRFGGSGSTDYDLQARIEQPIEIAGQRGLRIRAAARLGHQLEQEANETRWELRSRIVSTYRAGVVARERTRIAERLVDFSDEMLAIARRRQVGGDISLIDVRLAETDSAQARQAKSLADQDLRTAQFTLCELTGWPIDTLPLPRAGLEAPRPVPALETLLAIASERHPGLSARRAAAAEAGARVELEDRAAWPTPVFGVQFAREGAVDEPESYVVLGTVGVPLPFWERNQGERARARVDRRIAQSQAEASVGVLRAHVARAHSDLRAAAERLDIFTTSVAPSLENSLALLRRGFDAGEVPLVSIALARERFLQTQRDSLTAYAEYYGALAELESAIGAELPGTP